LAGNTPGQPLNPGSRGRARPASGWVISECGESLVYPAERPAGLMLGYGSDSVLSGECPQTRHYSTGDIALRDEDGCLFYVGRADDVFKASDYRISPFELESALIEHPAVAEAAVVPSPDALRTSVPKAFVVLASGYTPCQEVARELFLYMRRNLAPYKRIRRIEFAGLPKTISGKIRRAELRKSEQSRTEGRGALEFFEDDFPDIK